MNSECKMNNSNQNNVNSASSKNFKLNKHLKSDILTYKFLKYEKINNFE